MNELTAADGRTHINTQLMRESLVSATLGQRTESHRVRAMINNVSMIAIGGRSIMDKGSSAILPLIDAIVECKQKHRLIIGVGGGTRARHVQKIGLDLGLPNGGLARIVGGSEEQNRDILQFLLAPHGGVVFIKDDFQNLQLLLHNGMIPVTIGQPPYHCWEPPPVEGPLPDNGPDVGLFLMAEVFGAEHVLLVKDVDGVIDGDPAHAGADSLIRSICCDDLLDMELAGLPIEKELLRTLSTARCVNAVRVINGLQPDNLQRALAGEDIGTLIYNKRHPLYQQQATA